MPLPLEDYALIGDTHSAALVGQDGSIDWLCWPRFDSDACFAALLGSERHGRWLVAPASPVRAVRRRYRPGTLVLESEFDTDEGTVRLTDFLPPRGDEPDLCRVVDGVAGRVAMRLVLAPRFGYGDRIPWFELRPDHVEANAGPDAVSFFSALPVQVKGGDIAADFTVAAGEQVTMTLAWHPSHLPPPPPVDAVRALSETDAWWRAWSDHCTYKGPWREQVVRSLITLKALTYSPTGGIVAAPTTSLPEQLGGVRNWDYRFCWLRDATFTLLALMDGGYQHEAAEWRDWLVRAVAGEPSRLQIMYGVAGERRLTELELPWLPGYEGASPVRLGNLAAGQLQLDVFGEVFDCLHHARLAGLPPSDQAWALGCSMLDHLAENWSAPDEGIWEVRGPRRHFTHSKVMTWVAVDRAVKAVERFGRTGPVERWRRLRKEIHADVCRHGFDTRQGSFTQEYGAPHLDASLLMIPLVGFLPPRDPRVAGTVAAIQRGLCDDGFVHRYDTGTGKDGLPAGEGIFLACTLWLADDLLLLGRRKEAQRLFERVLALCNDVGLLSEEYDVGAGRLVGNFPQAFSHVALVNTALNLGDEQPPARQRAGQ